MQRLEEIADNPEAIWKEIKEVTAEIRQLLELLRTLQDMLQRVQAKH